MTIPRFTVLATLCAAFVLLLTAGVATAATNPSVEWSAAYGGSGEEFASSVEQTADGGYILVGSVLISDSGNRKDVLLVKTDASGNQQWSRTFSGGGWDSAHDLVQTADGGYAIAAQSDVRTIPGTSKGWLIKIDASGNQQWSKTFGGGYHDRLEHLIQVSDGGYVISGTADDTSGRENLWFLKTDASGNQQWSRTFGGGQTDEGKDLIRTADGGFAIAGHAGADGWLVKANASGNLTWAKTYPSPSGGGVFNSVQQTGDGGYVLAGFCGAINPGSIGDAWVVKTDASGTGQWSKAYGGVWMDIATAVFVLPGGGYLVAGTGWSQGMTTSDLGLFTLSSTGDQLWELVYGDGGRDEVYDGSQTADGGYVLAGLTSPYDMWLVKIQPGGGGGGGSNTFWDVPTSHPYHGAIEGIADAGVINGYDDGSFGPGKPVTRQQFAKMIVGTLGFPCSEADICYFSDVFKGGPTDLYPDNYVAVAAAYGITNGIGGGKYGPYRDITRAQVITMVVRAAQSYTAGLQSPDAAYYSGWGLFRSFNDPTHGNNAQLAEFNGLLTGLQGSGDIATWMWQPATRGEVAQILWNLSKAGVAG